MLSATAFNPINYSNQQNSNSNYNNAISKPNDVFAEANRLKEQGIIGKDSLIAHSFSQGTHISYWSEKDNSQYHAYKSLGNEAGTKAAAYLKEMIAQRQSLASDYLNQLYDLAEKFRDLEATESNFRNYFFDSLGNNQVPTNIKQGNEHDNPELIESFWHENQKAIEKLSQTLSNLESFPRSLDEWLVQQDKAIEDDVHLVIDQYKNHWATSKQARESDFQPSHVSVGSDAATELNTSSVFKALESLSYNIAKVKYESWGDTTNLMALAAQDYRDMEQARTLHEMHIISKDLFTEFSDKFGATSGSPGYSLQDLVDNFLSGNELSLLDNGNIHPLRDEISVFWEKNQLALEAYAEKQKQLNTPFEGLEYDNFFRRNKAEINQLMQANLEDYLNKATI